jgi:hypothetical protein
VDGDASPPVFLTLADKVKAAPGEYRSPVLLTVADKVTLPVDTGLSLLAIGEPTTKSGTGRG